MCICICKCLHVCEAVCDCVYVSVCVPTSPQPWRPRLPGTICFQLAASRLGEGPTWGSSRAPGGPAQAPSSAPSEPRPPRPVCLHSNWGSHTQSPLSCHRPLEPGSPQITDLPAKTFRNSSAVLTQACAKAGIPFAVEFYFIFLGGGVRGRGVLT